ncbi:MAG: type IV secretion system protein TraC [Sideroxydans sp.]|nr:type IV secretion system protein TraC [Sideroxydans sp.]MDD5056622.1 type IV secretion system protein TraC [Sideroxydans sp.]
MDIATKIQLQPERSGLPYMNIAARSFDPESGAFILQFNSGENRLGVCFEAQPITGADESTVSRLKSVLTTRFPKDTFIQFGLFSEPDVSLMSGLYLSKKIEARGILAEVAQKHVEMLTQGVEAPLRGMNNTCLNRQRVIVSITIPCSLKPSANEREQVSDLAAKLKEGLGSAGLNLKQMDESSYLALLRRFFYLYERDDFAVDDYLPTREQVFAPATSVDFKSKNDEINFDDGKYFAKMLAVKRYPKTAGIGLMNMLIGDPMGSQNQVTDPFWMSATIYYPDQEKKQSAVRTKYAWLTNQAIGPIARFIPMLGYKQRGMDKLIQEIDGDAGMLCELNFTMTLFSRSRERLSGLAAAWRAWAASFGFEMREDRVILRPLFYTVLPFGQSVQGIKNLYRFSTLCISHAIHHLPILGNWQGSGTGGMSLFIGRRGQLALFDPYDSPTNYNGFIVAEAGAGKSFVAQKIICDMRASGGRVWSIDQGRSQEKLCRVLGGQFIEFSEDSNICLNPFTHVVDIKEDMDMLKAVITKMAAPVDGLDDFRQAAIEAKILAAFSVAGHEADITLVAEQCLNDKDLRIKDIGTQLYPFTRQGSFGRWFNGANNVDLTNDYVVLELQDLHSKKVLQQVVLLLLFDSISHEMYLTSGRKKLLLVDEAWALLDDPIMGKAIEAAYRKVRKHEGAAWIITQSIADLYDSPVGRAIIGSSAWQIIMQQKPDSIEHALKSGNLKLDPYTLSMMKSIHTIPGRYSEMMIRSGDSWGVVRLIVDRFPQVLFSTKGWERDAVLDRIHAGENAVDVINELIAERG